MGLSPITVIERENYWPSQTFFRGENLYVTFSSTTSTTTFPHLAPLLVEYDTNTFEEKRVMRLPFFYKTRSFVTKFQIEDNSNLFICLISTAYNINEEGNSKLVTVDLSKFTVIDERSIDDVWNQFIPNFFGNSSVVIHSKSGSTMSETFGFPGGKIQSTQNVTINEIRTTYGMKNMTRDDKSMLCVGLYNLVSLDSNGNILQEIGVECEHLSFSKYCVYII